MWKRARFSAAGGGRDAGAFGRVILRFFADSRWPAAPLHDKRGRGGGPHLAVDFCTVGGAAGQYRYGQVNKLRALLWRLVS